MAGVNIPYMEGRHQPFNIEEVSDILNGNNDDASIMSEPPVRPHGGQVFLYRAPTERVEQLMDFRCDQYRWVSKGSNQHTKRKFNCGIVKRYYYIKDPNGTGKETLSGFSKHIYCLRYQNNGQRLFLIHYIGDHSLAQSLAHGNSLKERPFIPTKKSVIDDIKETTVTSDKPGKVYRDMQRKDNMSAHDSDMRMPTNKPRNVKQVYNAVHNKRKQRGIANDEIFALYELALQLEGFVWNISIYPEVLITVGLPDSLAHARQMMRESQLNPNLPQLMSYDTTFNLGDFYLSAFVVRNIFLNGDPISSGISSTFA